MAFSLEEFASSLGLPYEFDFANGNFIARLNTSDDFSNAFNMVSLNKELEVVDKQTVTENTTSFTFTDGYYQVRLVADYERDIYKVICEER